MEVINKLLESSEYADYLNNVDGVYFVINPTWTKIVVSMSGGADSALVAYQLSRIIDEKKLDIEVHVISNIRMWHSRPWQPYISMQVLEYLKNKFPSIKYTRHENFIAPDIEFGNIGAIIPDKYGRLKSGCQISARSFMEYVVAANKINAAYDGVTLNPPVNFDIDGMSDRTIEGLDTTSLKDSIAYISTYNAYMISPVKFVSKDWIVKQYKDYNILDLFNITRSCEGEFSDITFNTYTPGQYVPVCGKCFWCQERNWAMAQNNL